MRYLCIDDGGLRWWDCGDLRRGTQVFYFATFKAGIDILLHEWVIIGPITGAAG